MPSGPPPPSTCERCGEQFTCGAQTGSCWCQDVALSAETRRRIAAGHADCLCRSCLADHARTT